jgi:hypothetical protein
MKIYGAQLTGSIASTGNPVVTGSLTVSGNLTAQQFIVSSSVTFLTTSFSSGSTKFGDSSDDNHNFTGSLIVSGSANPFKVGSNLLFVSSSGNVGVGTTTPSTKLHVEASSPTRGIIGTIKNATQTGAQVHFVQDSVADWVIGQPANTNAFAFWNNRYPSNDGTELMRITSAGNVGIGTSSPASPLSIQRGSSGDSMEFIGSGASGYSDILFYNTNKAARLGYIDWSDTIVRFNVEANIPLVFFTNAAERMRINSGGSIQLGSTANYVNIGNDTGGVYMETVGSEDGRRVIRIQTGNSSFSNYSSVSIDGANQLVKISTSNTERMRITSIGAINILGSYFLANSGTGYRFNNQADSFNNFIISDNGNASLRGALTQNASDERLKNNIKIIPNAIDKIKKLRGVSFEWNQELYETSRTTDIGVIAQDIQKVLPDAVSLAPFDINVNDYTSKSGKNYLTVYYEKIIPLLIEGIKEQEIKIQELSDKNTALEEILQRNNIV